MASLIITINERKQGIDLPAILGKVTVIGSDDACDVTLKEVDGLSRRHCTITCTEKGFMLEDADSTNGTYADDEEVEEPVLMKEGVVYGIGDAAMIIAELANYQPTTTKEKPTEKTATTEAATAPIPQTSEAATAPIPETTEAPTAPITETSEAKTAPIEEEPAQATPTEAPQPQGKAPTHTRPLAGKRPARRAKQQRRALSDEELQQKAKMLASNFGGSGVSTLYVVIIIIAAFYAGMALYSWQSEGIPVPAFFR